MQDNVALIVVLEARDNGGFMDSQAASGKRGQLLCVVSILFWTQMEQIQINRQILALLQIILCQVVNQLNH